MPYTAATGKGERLQQRRRSVTCEDVHSATANTCPWVSVHARHLRRAIQFAYESRRMRHTATHTNHTNAIELYMRGEGTNGGE